MQVPERDVERLARYLRVSTDRFLADYTAESAEDGVILKRDRKSGCVFLNGHDCTVYEARPDICQRFPHLVRGQARSPAACGSSSTAPATARSSTTRSKLSRTSSASGADQSCGRGSFTGCHGR